MHQHQVRVLPLAPKPLCSPHPYDPAYRVEVQLDEPLWVPRVGPRDIAMEIMALCVQLDSFILTSAHNLREDSHDARSRRKVKFEQTLTSQATAVLQQMREQLRRAGMGDDVESYLRESGMNYLFPRVELYLQEPDQELDKIASPIMDGYFSHLATLNNVLTMAHQLNTDVRCCASHKYIAHQTALLYVCGKQSSLLSPRDHYLWLPSTHPITRPELIMLQNLPIILSRIFQIIQVLFPKLSYPGLTYVQHPYWLGVTCQLA